MELYKQDRRVKKTKKALYAALFSLIKEKNISKITVKELTDLADVNRSTFYAYYSDVYDMYEKVQNEIYTVFAEEIIPCITKLTDPTDLKSYLRNYLQYVKDNPDLCSFVLSNNANNQIAHRLRQSILDAVPDSHKYYPIEDPRHYLSTFVVYGCVFTIMEWLNDGMKTDPDKLAEHLANTYVRGSSFVKANG